MKSGPEFALSREKRAFDLFVSGSLYPAYGLGKLAVGRLLAQSGYPPSEVIFLQKRSGRRGDAFNIRKFLTKDPKTDIVINEWLETLRKLGVDELPQILNVIDGDMSVCGRRPVLSSEHEEIMDNVPPKLHRPWLQVVDGSRPGIVSSYGLYHHEHPIAGPEDYEIRAELDIKDYVDDSLVYDARLLGRFAALAVSNKFA